MSMEVGASGRFLPRPGSGALNAPRGTRSEASLPARNAPLSERQQPGKENLPETPRNRAIPLRAR